MKKKLEMPEVEELSFSFIKDFTIVVENLTLETIIGKAQGDDNKEIISKIRTEQDKEIKNKLKKGLLGFTPSGEFKTTRKKENLISYSKVICLDFDDIKENKLKETVQNTNANKFTRASFISPSGNGLKVFVLTNGEVINHNDTYQKVKDFFEPFLGISADPSGKDIARLCFLSHDPNAYYNPDSEVFEVSLDTEKEQNHGLDTVNDLLDEIVRFTSKKEDYFPSNRNNYIFLFASNCNRQGIEKEIALNYAKQNYNLPSSEIQSSFDSAYKEVKDFGKFNSTTLKGEALSETAYFLDDIYKLLPPAFNYVHKLSDKRQKDIFILASLTVLSGGLSGISGIYGDNIVCPNLFTLFVAPPASGKSAMKIAKYYGNGYHKEVINLSKDDFEKYKKEMVVFKQKKIKNPENAPVKPLRSTFFIPGDSSQAVFTEFICSSSGTGVIFETEADVLSGMTKQDWGINSTNLRASFHNETISVARKGDELHLEMESPKFSGCLSGTPQQLVRLVESIENGLFSRFLYYSFKTHTIWKDPSPKINIDSFEKDEKELENIGYDIIQKYKGKKVEVKLSPAQWDRHNNFFRNLLDDSKIYNGDDSSSIIFRNGVMAYKLYSVLTAVRNYQELNIGDTLSVDEKDMDIALEIIRVCSQHSLNIYNNMPSKNSNNFPISGTFLRDLLLELPLEFERKQAIYIGTSKYNLSPRTVDSLLSNATNCNILEKTKAGFYKKLN